jgi:hypothetical protein
MPKMLGPTSADPWEREVQRLLRCQLPDDWFVVSNIGWAFRDGGVVKDGQCDFVVLVPDLGMAILEVKGSKSVRIGDDGVWYRQEMDSRTNTVRNEERIKEPPPEQASRNMHTLAKLVCERLPRTVFPGAYAFVVAYPNGIVQSPSMLYDPTTLIASTDMGRLTRRIRDALEARRLSSGKSDFSPDLASRVAAILADNKFRVVVHDVPLDAREDTDAIEELTRQQFAAVRGMFDHPSVAVVGPAGSGKTLLARWKLESMLQEGKRAVYVCFNKALAEHLRLENPGLAAAVWSVDKLFAKIAGLPVGQLGDSFFREELPSRVLDVTFKYSESEKYEAIIVDEGQDFGESRLIALLGLLVLEGQWLFFADWRQNVYQAAAQEALGAEVTFRLYHNCRNTKLVNSATNGYCTHTVESMPGAPIGAQPIVRKCQASAMAAAAWGAMNELSPEGGGVFLSPYRLENSCLASTRKGYGLEITEDIAKLGKSGYVFFSTVRSFKGIEGCNVVLLQADIPARTDAFSLDDLYVACTRTTGRLAIIVATDEASRWYSERVIGSIARSEAS